MTKKQENRRFLGLDWGEKRIGLALSEAGLNMALPYGVASTLSEVLEVIEEERIDLIVMGAPFKMRGAQESMNPHFLEFLETLKKRVKVPVELIDERLSSKAADALEGSYKDNKAPRDAVAAMLILQGYLDKQK